MFVHISIAANLPQLKRYRIAGMPLVWIEKCDNFGSASYRRCDPVDVTENAASMTCSISINADFVMLNSRERLHGA
ncbi:MAG: hypothetical protein JJ992_21485 [Planctomycetes bacterium]|nr:hypothetical protein [Planctomycetota bacterium]